MTRLEQRLRRAAKFAVLPLILASVAACTTPFKADVSRFQSQMPAPAAGESYYVVADDPALSGGLEFAQYADLVEAQMNRLGYVEAASPDAASLLVRFDYDVDNGREKVRSTGFYDPFYSPWYGFHRPFYRSSFGYYRPRYFGSSWGFGFHDPWFGNDIDSYTVYTSGIELKIDRAATGERLFEGKAKAVSTSNRLPYLVPNLVEAMFTEFPGNSGETVRISIAPEKKTVRKLD